MNWLVLVAAGRGARMGAPKNKVLLELCGVPVLIRTLEAFVRTGAVQGTVLVVGVGEQETVDTLLRQYGLRERVNAIVAGGAHRQASVANGLTAVPPDAEIILVHDAARPLVTEAVILDTISAARAQGSGVAAIPLKDTVKRVDARDIVLDTPPREALRAVQTPQTFRAALLRDAYAWAQKTGLVATDDAALVEGMGEAVQLTHGDVENIKITTPEDLAVAESILRARNGESIAPVMRVGTGYDVHKLVVGRKLILCGVEVPFEKGLLGHSDADVAAHALSDALLGAAGLGDIGRHFPDTDPAYKGADSIELLRQVAAKVAARGYCVGNVDVTIVAQRPKLKDYIPRMTEVLAGALQVDAAQVNVKATTTEGMGFEGEGLGISSQAVATLIR